jgi:malate dehydrogenase
MMAFSISIIGASGAVGSTLASQILRSGLLQPLDRLQLVAHGRTAGSARLVSTRIDLMDAFDDTGVEIEVVANLEDVDADIVVVCAGISQHDGLIDRREWGVVNLELFERIASICARQVPDAFFVIVSNPVELAVKIFSEQLGRERVIGMGAEQDSLRFARAIAHDLRTSRQHVTASVLGEHGQSMVPLWSSVALDRSDPLLLEQLERMRVQSTLHPLEERVASLRAKVLDLIRDGKVSEAYETTRQELPDARIFVQPLVTWHTIGSTPNATANSALQFLTAAMSEIPVTLRGQVMLSGEFLDIHGVCGVPLEVNRDGWKVSTSQSMTAGEDRRVMRAAASIDDYVLSVSLQMA